MSELTPAGTPVPMDLMMLLTGVRKLLTEDTIEDVVAGTGITRQSLYAIRDERRLPSFDSFQRLVDYYGYHITVTTHRVPTYEHRTAPRRVVIVTTDEPKTTPIASASKGKTVV